MSNPSSQHNRHKQEGEQHTIKRSIQHRARTLYVFFTFIAVMILGQIILTIFGPNGTPLRNLSEDRCYTTRPVEGSRGNIYDRSGELLSTDSRTYTIRLDLAAEPLTDELFAKNIGPLSDSLSRLLGRPKSHYVQLLSKTRTDALKGVVPGARYKLLTRHLNQRDYDRLCTFPLMQRRYGMIAESERTRYKLYGSMAAYTISHGIERAYDSLLMATDGVNRYVRLDSRGRHEAPIVDKINRTAEHGSDIYTTIDINMQDVVEGALRNQLSDNSAISGTAVVVECATGEIRAMANLTRRSSGEMNDDFNYAIRWHGAPGSTFKGISLMALLDEAGISPQKRVDCGTTTKAVINRLTVRDTHPVGKTDVKGMFVESSNIGFAKVVNDVYGEEPDRWVNYIRNIGLNEVSSIQRLSGLGFYIKDPSTFHERGGWSHTTLTQTAYGYEVNMTPLQTLMFYNAVANDGKLVKPILIKSVVKDGEVVEEYATEVVNEQICSPKALAQLRDCMEAVVTSKKGTGHSLSTLPFGVAGKTGTAQVMQPREKMGKTAYELKDGSREYLATFVGYFPAEAPKYTCIVSIKTLRKKGENKPYTGAGVSLPVFRDIAEYIYSHSAEWMPTAKQGVYDAPKQGIKSHTMQEGEVLMPNIVGMGLRDAIYTLESYGLRVRHSGKGKVVSQSIKAGTPFTEGEDVEIVLKTLEQKTKKKNKK